MQKKMIRFLSSIGLEDIERFDLDFVLTARNPYQPVKIDMVVEKSLPWDYALLSEFLDAYSTIRYPHTLRFTYLNNPTCDDCASLFYSWYFSLYHDLPPLSLEKENEDTVRVIYPGDAEKARCVTALNDFRELLKCINYPFILKEEIRLPEPEDPTPALEADGVPFLSAEEEDAIESIDPYTAGVPEPALEPEEDVPEEMPAEEEAPLPQEVEPSMPEEEPQIEPEAEPEPPMEEILQEEEAEESKPAEIEVVEQEAPEEDEEELGSIEVDHNKLRAAGEEILEDELERNLRIMVPERNHKRIWTMGDYRPQRNIAAIFTESLGNVDVAGVLFETKTTNTKKGGLMLRATLGDDSEAIPIRGFESKRFPQATIKKVADGQRYRVRGAIDIDKRTKQRCLIIHYLDRLPDKEFRQDNEPIKRVELHLHTNMSTMDGVPEFSAYYNAAKAMGMDAIAVTDHGCVQSFPAAQACHDGDKNNPLKIIYGCELYMFDLEQNYIANPAPIPLNRARYCVFDTETTGLSARYDRLIEFGGVIVENGIVVDRMSTLINPEIDLSLAADALAINHIDPELLPGAPTFEQLADRLLHFMEGSILVAHNASFDVGFLNASLQRIGRPPLSQPVIDTIPISHYLFPEAGRHTEGALLRNLGLTGYNETEAHRADYDAEKLNDGWQEIILRLEKMHPGITHEQLQTLMVDRGDDQTEEGKKQAEKFNAFCRHLRESHVTVLAKNKQGVSDLYRIVSEGHTTYLARVPKTPRSLIAKYRENFLVGSSCFNGEIFELATTRNLEDLVEAMRFYDFIEIQPLENYSYLINMGRSVRTEEHLIEVLRDIVKAAKIAGKPVVATGDCHYVDPEDKILRDVYIYAQGIGHGSHPLYPPARKEKPVFPNPDQHFRSTKEMLDSFKQWMSPEEAYECVVTNSRAIAEQIENNILIVYKDVHAPDANLPNSAAILRDLCEKHFHERYDYTYDDDPKVLEAVDFAWKRLQRELSGIIDHGYAVTYYIAHRLIQLANDEPEHYIVGSRGSVGSSFAATMADITEVNALPAHYQCPHCHYLEFMDINVYKSGFDLPNRKCPKCGEDLVANGQNIPFETFLGFHAEKVPDIDLNFEDESQHKAHDYCKDLLGEANVYRAGTIETVAEKTAFGYVRGYFEKIGKDPKEINPSYISYIAYRCQGVKRTTGQHPGGIVVVPADDNVFNFTPVQHPADDLKSSWLTTHFDFHSMHDTLLKLDELGHDVPTIYKYLEEFSGRIITEIPMSDPDVYSLFTSPEVLGVNADDLLWKTGTLGIPEMGTNFVCGMLLEAKPKNFSDLLQISGLSHGTDVWLGNAQELIKNGTCTISEVIGTRDSIMTYLIYHGMDPSLSFKIMEITRKGNAPKLLTEEMKQDMRDHDVPEGARGGLRHIGDKALLVQGTRTPRVLCFDIHRPR